MSVQASLGWQMLIPTLFKLLKRNHLETLLTMTKV